jgi:hypothetical protein
LSRSSVSSRSNTGPKLRDRLSFRARRATERLPTPSRPLNTNTCGAGSPPGGGSCPATSLSNSSRPTKRVCRSAPPCCISFDKIRRAACDGRVWGQKSAFCIQGGKSLGLMSRSVTTTRTDLSLPAMRRVSASSISNFTHVLESDRALANRTKTADSSSPFRIESRKSTPG